MPQRNRARCSLDTTWIKILLQATSKHLSHHTLRAWLNAFSNVDLSKGAPMRELVGCLCWTTMNLRVAEITRVKSHSAILPF
jgi:hypothetical protein